jgi:soluble lytic murein transglycosylase-like protein
VATVVDLITAEAQSQGFDPAVAIEVARAESNLNPNTPDSSAGAIGLFQLEPATAAQLGVNPRILADNIRGGITYLRQLLAQFGTLPPALAAYNWGMGNVGNALAQFGADFLSHAPAETQNYVAKILGNLGQYTASVTPASIANGVTDVLAPLAAPGDNTLTGIAILTGLALAVYLVAEVLSD